MRLFQFESRRLIVRWSTTYMYIDAWIYFQEFYITIILIMIQYYSLYLHTILNCQSPLQLKIKIQNLNVSSSFFIFQCCWKILLHKKRPYILQKQNIIPFFAPSLLCTKIYSLTFEICRQKKLVGSFLTNELTCLS